MNIPDARKLSPKAQESIRMRAVQAVLDGKARAEVSAVFGVSRIAVWKWLKAYHDGGVEALKAKPQGRPQGGGKLKGHQASWVARQVRGKCPDQLRLPFMLWTREAVGGLIERKFGITLALSTVGRYLRTWGFTPQKPIRKAYEQNPIQVRYWLRTKYPAIQQEAKQSGARIYWGDEMGLRSDHAVGRTWGVKGQTPVVMATGNRFGCNMISAITNQGNLSFMVFEKHFTSAVFIEFLRRLARQNEGRPVFLIVDRHRVHRSRQVAAWLAANPESIRLFYLPSYSPELNPDELLNQDIKSNSVGNRRAKDKGELLKNVRGYLKSRQRKPTVVCNYFNGEHVRYAA